MKKLTEKQAHDLSEILLYIDNSYDLYKVKFNAFVDCNNGVITAEQLRRDIRKLVAYTASRYLNRTAEITRIYAINEIMAEYYAEKELGNFNNTKKAV